MKVVLLLLTLCVPAAVKAQADTTARLDWRNKDQTVTVEYKSDPDRHPVFEMYVDPVRFEGLSRSEKMQIIHNLERWILLEKRRLMPKPKETPRETRTNQPP